MSKLEQYMKLKSGTDIRGVAVETENSPVQLTDETVFNLTVGFVKWLEKEDRIKSKRIAVGHDSRISAERIKTAVILAVNACGITAVDCSYASTPAMFMTTVDLDVDASIQITASHHPFDRNGLKFFTPDGGLDHEDIVSLIEFASASTVEKSEIVSVEKVDYMKMYANRLRKMICEGIGSENYEKPLEGFKIVVDAGNGVGGFYATDVLAPLGADVSGSQFLEPDGMFPNHAPNPENKAAMESVCKATVENCANLGIIFDTDVDRAGCVDENGKEINRNRLIALASVIALEGNEGGTIVTDSVTSTGLAKFITELGGVHYRYRRGYRNVINKQLELNKAGINCPLAIETSGHGAFRDNYYLDDGAYLITRIIIKAAQLRKAGKKIEDLIERLECPADEIELRPKIKESDFTAYGNSVIAALEEYAKGKETWIVADDNREGIRVYLRDGWFILRLSVHDPIMPFNAESDSSGGVKSIVAEAYEFLKGFDGLDLGCFEEYRNSKPNVVKACPSHKTSVGGQALIEGIMMQGPKGAAVSVRTPNGEIETEMRAPKHARDKLKPLGWPIIRGVVNFIESMIFGYNCLMLSAEKSGMEDVENDPEKMSKVDKWLEKHMNKKFMAVLTGVASVLGVVLAVGLFMWLPTIITNGFNKLSDGALTNFRALIEGVMRMIIFVAYIALVSLMKDIKRTFMYHGAEHKTIFCYENGCDLTVENVRKQSRFHPRCGTSFMFVIIIISILISSVVSVCFPHLRDVTAIWMGVKFLILPVVMGLGYEFIKYAGKHDNIFVKILSAPGLWMQRLTTKEPEDEMIEVAIAAFTAVITDDPEDDKIK